MSAAAADHLIRASGAPHGQPSRAGGIEKHVADRVFAEQPIPVAAVMW
jgi:hypothetical protein